MLRNYIGGEWTSSLGVESVEIINPASGALLDKCPLGTAEDIDRAVSVAQTAFQSWKRVPVVDRVQPLFKLKALLEHHLDELAHLVTQENGKTLVEARGSVRRGIQMVETACGMPTLMMGEATEDIAAGIDSFSVRRPLGVFATIAPFNFPAMVPFWFWPFAVAAGNTVIVKPSERVPLTQTRIFELIGVAGFPHGTVNLVHGGKETVNALCNHPLVKGISFVGSTPVAKHVYQTACAQGKRVQALGGAKNFMVVLPDATMDKAAKTALESIIGCAGERCLAGSVVICVGKETAQKIRDLMVKEAREITVGPGTDPKNQMGPVISQVSKDRIKGLIESAVQEGAKLLLDGRQGVDQMPGYFLKPSVVDQVKPQMKIAQEEIFGPVVCLGEVQTLQEAVEWINSSPYANTTTLFTNSGAAARKFSCEVDPSMIGINIGVPAPMAFFSFGGSKDSFFGDVKAHGSQCLNFFTETRVTIQRWESNSSIW